jgi:type IV pilus assembly protein PilB
MYEVVPVEYNSTSKRLKIAMKSPDNFRAVDDLKMLMGFNVEAVIGDPALIDALIKKHFAKVESVVDVVSSIKVDPKFQGLDLAGDKSIDLDALTAAANDNQVIKLINLVLLQAIKDRASDIHFEPFENEFKMRYRIDGVLYEMVPPPKQLGPAITSRIKVMAHLDIAERRLPQDGRIELKVAGKPVDLRIAVLPTIYGESVVMRVLDRANVELALDRIGLRQDDYEKFEHLVRKPNGIVVVTGPTGSGKTTTLYAALSKLNDIETKILTVEDPVEYDIDGLLQCQVNEEAGLTFGKALRSFLRQDPDIILVGEIRDLETAQIAVQASLTGHLVLSTLHTNDAPSSIIRLIDLGMEPFLLTATIEGIVAQRLVRTICPKCKEQYEPKEEELMELNLLPADVRGKRFSRGRGCDNCNKSGYRGRMALFEIMGMDDEMRELVMQQANTTALRAHARRRGMRSLRESGLLSIYEGQTTIDEVVRETISEED